MTMLSRLRSVRSILTLWYSALLLAAFAVFGIAVQASMKTILETSLEQNLQEEVDWMTRLAEVEALRYRTPGELEGLSSDIEHRIHEHFLRGPRNYVVELATATGRVLYRSGVAATTDLRPGTGKADFTHIRVVDDERAGRLRVASRRVEPLIITVAASERSIAAVLDHILTVMLVLAPAALLMAVGGGYLMAGIALRPVLQIARLTDRITAQRLDLRLPRRPVDDELGVLITTINTMIARLEQSFDRIRQFSMDVAHELKTPLTIVKGEAELALADPRTPDGAQRLAALTLEESTRMGRIVDDLLTLAKADAGQLEIRHAPVHLDAVLGEVHEDALILAGDRGLTVELRANPPLTVEGDEARLRQLFRALVMNAVLYTDPGGSIRLSSAAEGGEAVVDVRDTGIGIAPEDHERIFQRLYRVDRARSRVRGGSGLGLSIARWIAEAHRGSIGVSSAPGEGSCFTVRLPLQS